ncbi:hypothetical protein WJX72_002181 [[Myrmecia] bisecta]|uniref:Uncharacterized protein n=1 Tax=[Myrmecia] bisecta TaxID=41462 RepID=A0AAW1P8E6_9CHLO
MSNIERLILANLSPDADVGHGDTLLHQLFKQTCPPGVDADGGSAASEDDDEEEDGEDDEFGGPRIPLAGLLQRGATPDRTHRDGDTVLHILIRNTLDGTYFPDDSLSGAMYSGEIERVEERAEYVEAAFKLLVDAGWSVAVRSVRGQSVLDAEGGETPGTGLGPQPHDC